MFAAALAHFLVVTTLAALTSTQSLCIRGCCGLTLKLPSTTLSLSPPSSSKTDETGGIELPVAELPCCNCSDESGLSGDKSQSESLAGIPGGGMVIQSAEFFKRTTFCPSSCPCCDNCVHLDTCRGPHRRMSYPALLNAVGCNNLPLTTRLCPTGKCSPDCLCREKLLEEVKNILFHRDDKEGMASESTEDIISEKAESQHPMGGEL